MKIFIRTAEENFQRYGDKAHNEDELVIEYGVTGYDNTDEIALPLADLAKALAPYLQPKDGIHKRDGKWYFWDEAQVEEHGPYESREHAIIWMREYCDRFLATTRRSFSPGSDTRLRKEIKRVRDNTNGKIYDRLAKRKSGTQLNEQIKIWKKNGLWCSTCWLLKSRCECGSY